METPKPNLMPWPELSRDENRARMVEEIIEGGDRDYTKEELEGMDDSLLWCVWIRA